MPTDCPSTPNVQSSPTYPSNSCCDCNGTPIVSSNIPLGFTIAQSSCLWTLGFTDGMSVQDAIVLEGNILCTIIASLSQLGAPLQRIDPRYECTGETAKYANISVTRNGVVVGSAAGPFYIGGYNDFLVSDCGFMTDADGNLHRYDLAGAVWDYVFTCVSA